MAEFICWMGLIFSIGYAVGKFGQIYLDRPVVVKEQEHYDIRRGVLCQAKKGEPCQNRKANGLGTCRRS